MLCSHRSAGVERGHVVAEIPVIVDMEVTNRCNAKCYFCPRDATPHQGLMSPEIFEKGFERALAIPEAIRVNAREITVDEEVNEAAANVEVPTHVIVVERGTMDQPGGMIPLDVARSARGPAQ